MNAVEIEEAVSKLAEAPFDAATFPYDFLQAFGNNDAAIRKLKNGDTNKSDLRSGVLQRNKNNIHLLACPPGEVAAALDSLRKSAATQKYKARFIFATDGQTIQAERSDDGEPLACDYKDLPNRFAYFLSLAGISTVKRIDENAFDIRATGRLNKLYVELLRTNPDWDTDARRQDLNHFFARLIFCFFAEDTGIFPEAQLFTSTVEQMTLRDGSNTHEVLAKLFDAMNTPREARAEATHLPGSAMRFPYVNGNLFGGSTDTPRFNQAARNYLLFVGKLDWKQINPDIFGSMIQAVADDEERGALGMHYTSVPNILKVLNPLFLDDLRAKLAEANDSPLKLLNLRKRLARIRVFDPACGSGNFLVIAYKEMRQIEAEINQRRGERGRKSEIPVSNFRGIELRSFPAEIARLALIIAEFQCDVLHRSELLARSEFLPLKKENWIVCGNALRLDWLTVCPPTGTGVKIEGDGLFKEKLDQVEIDFENAGGETYICGNPPYLGSTWQSDEQKEDIRLIFGHRTRSWASLDYVAAWFMKAADYGASTTSAAAFVATNSICQGQQVPILWPLIFGTGHEIASAHTSFKWANLASHNAGVIVVVVQIAKNVGRIRRLFSADGERDATLKETDHINAYLAPGRSVIVRRSATAISGLPEMTRGNIPYDGGNLLLTPDDLESLGLNRQQQMSLVRRIYGSAEFIRGIVRYCLWIQDDQLQGAMNVPGIAARVNGVRAMRLASRDAAANKMAVRAHRMREMNIGLRQSIALPCVSSESRAYFPVGLVDCQSTLTNLAFALYDAPLWCMALIASRLHVVWIGTVCGKLKTDYRYSNTLGWNTFPVPTLTDENKSALTRCAEDILLAREAHFPATIAEMYDPEAMDTKFPDLRAAHERNDETLERIYIGRRFRNDTDRLEKLFEMYTQMTASHAKPTSMRAGRKKKS